jgi:hypothetical protein
MAKEKANKTPESKLESLSGKCIVLNKGYNSYYYGGASYGSELKKAMIFDFDNIPDYIKRDQDEEVIPLDSERGLKLLVDEMHNIDHYISIEKPRIRDAEEGLTKLYNFDLVQEYVKRYNGMNPLIRKPDEETKHNLVERVIGERDKAKPKTNPETENNARARKDLTDDLFNKQYPSN